MKLVITVSGEKNDLWHRKGPSSLSTLFRGISQGLIKCKVEIQQVFANPKEGINEQEILDDVFNRINSGELVVSDN